MNNVEVNTNVDSEKNNHILLIPKKILMIKIRNCQTEKTGRIKKKSD